MYKSNFRLTAVFDKDGGMKIKFSDNKEDSHRSMLSVLKDECNWDYDILPYARFYSLLCGNSRKPLLIVYGESSDYSLEGLSYTRAHYEDQIGKLAISLKYDWLFLS